MFDPHSVRPLFPALERKINGRAPVFFDGPGGTQTPKSVIDAIGQYITSGSSNLIKSPFFTVDETRRIVGDARAKAATFVNAASPEQIVFGANMSTITAHFSRSIAREWKAGDEIILTALDHSANVSYWKQIAQDKGVTCRVARLKKEDCTLDYAYLESLISKKTKLIAFGLASNVCGSLSDAQRIMKIAKAAGAVTFIDAVHYAPHFLPDARALDCDFMVFSPYKFFGPHMGFLYGKKEFLERLVPYKVEPALNTPPDKWETGTKNFEALAGFIAAVDYIASLGEKSDSLRARLGSSYRRVMEYEQAWSRGFLDRAKNIKGLRIWGITDPAKADKRTSTFAMTMEGRTPQEISDHLSDHGICAGAGTFYGVGVTDALGLTDKGGMLRVGCVHYNTMEELDYLFEVLEGF